MHEAPLWLRVNRRRASRDELRSACATPATQRALPIRCRDALVLRRQYRRDPLARLRRGTFLGAGRRGPACRDAARSARRPRVLDACAAPGGKTRHRSSAPTSTLPALDVDAARLRARARKSRAARTAARVAPAMRREPAAWWDGAPSIASCSMHPARRPASSAASPTSSCIVAPTTSPLSPRRRRACSTRCGRRCPAAASSTRPVRLARRECAADEAFLSGTRTRARALPLRWHDRRARHAKYARGVGHGRILLCDGGKVYLAASAASRSSPVRASRMRCRSRRPRSRAAISSRASTGGPTTTARRARSRHPARFRVHAEGAEAARVRPAR